MNVSTSSLISSSVRASPFCEACSIKSRKFMCRLLPRIKEDNHVFYPSLTRSYICVYIHTTVCIYSDMYMVTAISRPVVTIYLYISLTVHHDINQFVITNLMHICFIS
jgi:hypothetical protein